MHKALDLQYTNSMLIYLPWMNIVSVMYLDWDSLTLRLVVWYISHLIIAIHDDVIKWKLFRVTSMTSIIHVWQRRSWLLPSTSPSRCRHPAPGQDLIPLQRLHVFAQNRGPHPAIKLWCQVPFTKSKTIFQIEIYCMHCFLKSKYIKSRTINYKNRWIIQKVMVLKKLLPHVATRGTYSPGDWRCDEAWREQTLVYPPVMCQQRLSCCCCCCIACAQIAGLLTPGGGDYAV